MIETLETVEIGYTPAELKDCPFCGATPYWLGVVIARMGNALNDDACGVEPHFYHPGVATDSDCILSGRGYTLDDVSAWNTREQP